MSAEQTDSQPTGERTIVGLTEFVSVRGTAGSRDMIARIDTGATKSSIDLVLASKLGLGPVVDSKLIKSAYGVRLRPVVQADIVIAGRVIRAKFTLADRLHMKFPVLIGQNILKKGFLVDPSRRVDLPQKKRDKEAPDGK
jgi:hypothetical protein